LPEVLLPLIKSTRSRRRQIKQNRNTTDRNKPPG
jgi:hypothetical protein